MTEGQSRSLELINHHFKLLILNRKSNLSCSHASLRWTVLKWNIWKNFGRAELSTLKDFMFIFSFSAADWSRTKSFKCSMSTLLQKRTSNSRFETFLDSLNFFIYDVDKNDGNDKIFQRYRSCHIVDHIDEIIIIYRATVLVTSLAPSSYWEFSLLKLNVERAPETSTIFGSHTVVV